MTGVQTCALPISSLGYTGSDPVADGWLRFVALAAAPAQALTLGLLGLLGLLAGAVRRQRAAGAHST